MNVISQSLIIMKETLIVAFIICFVAVNCNVLFPLDSRDLNTACDTSDGSKGVYKLPSQCQHQNLNYEGYIKSVGACVCCPSIAARATAENAKRYCLKFGADKPTQLDFHVLDGEDAEEAEYPHMASLGYDNLGDISFDCGGSLIHSRFVLTAAHCCNKRLLQPTVVRLGRTSIDLNDTLDKSSYVDAKIKSIKIHKNYSARSKYDDIALIELEDEVKFVENIKPICLQTESDVHEQGRLLTVIGFGISDINTRKKSDWLQRGNVREMPVDDCMQQYGTINVSGLAKGIVRSQLCVKNDTLSAVDTCQGDSGSPLQLTSDEGKYYLVGLTSFGLGCGSSFPSVYTRISEYIEWIENVVWNGQNSS